MWQQHGIGTQLIEYITQNADVDYLSSEFWIYTKELAQFWQKCGFSCSFGRAFRGEQWFVTSAIALKGLSPQGS